MTEQEYDSEMDVIEKSYQQMKKELYIKYATAQRLYKVGDIKKMILP